MLSASMLTVNPFVTSSRSTPAESPSTPTTNANRFYVDPATVSEEQAARQRANMATMRSVAGEPYMHDPTLLDSLGRITIPVLVIWGDSDRIVTPAYGAAYAAAFAAGRL